MLPLKPAISIQDQIALLRKRGMIIDNVARAEEFLTSNQYYRLNIYFHKLMDARDHFPYGTSFNQLMSIYANDSWLRNRILTLLEPIEIRMRTQTSYYLGITYGSDAFYQPQLSKNEAYRQQIVDNFLKEVARNSDDSVIRHHNLVYGSRYPIWVVIEYLSFNTLSKYYSNLRETDKKQIARHSFHINDNILGNWLHVLSVLRNICAHYGYLYGREYTLRPKLLKEFNWDPTKNYHLFALCLIMRKLSNKIDWQNFIYTIVERLRTNQSFQLQSYGFPENWEVYLL